MRVCFACTPLLSRQLNPDGAAGGDKGFVGAEKCDGRWDAFLPTLPAALDGLIDKELEKKCSGLLEETTKVMHKEKKKSHA